MKKSQRFIAFDYFRKKSPIADVRLDCKCVSDSSYKNLFQIGAMVQLLFFQVVTKEQIDLIHVVTEWYFLKLVAFIHVICNQL